VLGYIVAQQDPTWDFLGSRNTMQYHPHCDPMIKDRQYRQWMVWKNMENIYDSCATAKQIQRASWDWFGADCKTHGLRWENGLQNSRP
jgi:hypothetical protein